MSSGAVSGDDVPRERRSPFGIADWPVWSLPGRVRLPVLLVEATAVMLAALLARDLDVAPTSWVVAGVLALIGLAHTEIAVRVERTRRRVTEDLHVDLTSVWTFAGALLLPATLAAGVAVVVHGYVWWRSWRPRVPLYKQLFSTATVVLACIGASVVVSDVGDPGPWFTGVSDLWAALVAMLVYTTVNSCLVAGAIAVSAERPGLAMAFGRWTENALELATLSLGALTAMAVSINPVLVAFALPPLLVLHRAVLVRHLEQAANTDPKTGLLNAAAWHAQAERELRGRAGSTGRAACWFSTWTTSRRSTTPTATWSATRCWPRSPGRCAPRSASATWPGGSAARSSSCCSAAGTGRPVGTCTPSPNASAGGSRRCRC
jgi:hypothetical protein